MNSKRYAALGIAIMVCILSVVFSYAVKTKEEKNADFLNKFINDALAQDKLVPVEVDEVALSKGVKVDVNSDKIQLIDVEGVISAKPRSSFGVFATSVYDHQYILKQIKIAEYDENVKALIIRVNSPGGSVYESAEVHDALQQLKSIRDIPIYVCMQTMAASGGYYISCPADKIYAGKDTITGSIGVIMGGLNFAGLFEKYGVEDMTIKSGKMKDVPSSKRKMTEEEKKYLQAFVDSAYGRFVEVVAEGRDLDIATVKELADGRIYDGVQAKKNGLIDEIGYFEDALADLRSEYDLEVASLIRYESSTKGRLRRWISAKFDSFKPSILSDVERGFRSGPEAYYLYGGAY